MRVYNSYSDVMFTPWKLRRVVKELSVRLPALMEEYDFDTIAVSGKSGFAVAFALSMVMDIKVVAVRKGESSHGDMVEGPGDHAFTRYAFFDDFISSGSTMKRVHAELENYASKRPGTETPECVLCIEYQGYASASGFGHREPIGGIKRYRIADPSLLPGGIWEFDNE